MKALLLFWHGIGDTITLTPALRYLKSGGYESHILCKPGIEESGLLSHCPHAKVITVPVETTPASNTASSARARQQFKDTFAKMKPEYDLSLSFVGGPPKVRGGKIIRNMKVCGAPMKDVGLEVFIPQSAEDTAREYIAEHYPGGYIFKHSRPSSRTHDWGGAEEWIEQNLPDLPVFDTGRNGPDKKIWGDINVSFVMAREARHRVLASSVFVHACDAMNVPIDVVAYGKSAPHAWPLDSDKIKVVKCKS